MINHQSVIYNRDLLLKNKFNDTYRIVGDYEQLLRMWKDIKPYPALLNGFVFYDKNGVSSNRENLVRIWSERARAIKASDLPIIWKMIAYTYARAALIYRKIIS